MLTSYKGTPLNMAPEILDGQEYTNKVDVYSAGTILYQMLYECCPFEANSQHEIALKIKKGLYFPPQRDVSKPVKKMIAQMLEENPEKRVTLEEVFEFIAKHTEK